MPSLLYNPFLLGRGIRVNAQQHEPPRVMSPTRRPLQCICEWSDRDAVFARLEREVRRELAAGRLPPVQPFHAMAYPFPADLALAVSIKCAPWTLPNNLA